MKKLFLFTVIALLSLNAIAQTGVNNPDELAIKLFEAVSKNDPAITRKLSASYDAVLYLQNGNIDEASRLAGVYDDVLASEVTEVNEEFVRQGVDFNLPVTKATTEVVKFDEGDFKKAIVKYHFTIKGAEYIVSAFAVQYKGKWFLLERLKARDQDVEKKK